MSNQHFSKPLVDVIRGRCSVRTYRPESLAKEDKEQLTAYADRIRGPFDAQVRLVLVDSAEIAEKAGGKIGTYGVIKGARDYVAAVMEKGAHDLEQVGYVLEALILYAASLGLGTCWLGGTFRRSDFARLVALKDNEMMPAVTPIGYPGDKKSMLESFMRFAAGSNNRKPWQELFFHEKAGVSLTESEAGAYREALDAVRLAPSASNKQPWRIVKDKSGYHFYLKPNKGYGERLGFNIQRIDLGIAMCHFEMMLQESGIEGMWEVEDPRLEGTGEMVYTVSWREK